MEREKIKKSMVWCLDHSDSAEEVVTGSMEIVVLVLFMCVWGGGSLLHSGV